MLNDLIKLLAYAVVFSTFNVAVFIIYFIYDKVILKKAKKIQHSYLTVQQISYLKSIKFVNARYEWTKKFGTKVNKFSIVYLILSEIVCFFAVLLSDKYVLICRIALFTDAFMILAWIFLLVYFRKKSKALSEQHKKNLETALKDYRDIPKTQNK